jgi:hypothetical protein
VNREGLPDFIMRRRISGRGLQQGLHHRGSTTYEILVGALVACNPGLYSVALNYFCRFDIAETLRDLSLGF